MHDLGQNLKVPALTARQYAQLEQTRRSSMLRCDVLDDAEPACVALQITGLACDILLIIVWSRLWILSDARKRYSVQCIAL